MRLYLSSFRLGNDPAEFVRLARGHRVGLIMNALDHRSHDRDIWLEGQTADLSTLGFEVREIDLRAYFGKPRELAGDLDALDALWINGGNTFILRRAMRQSGFDDLIADLLNDDRILYGGFSAATVIAAPSLKGLEMVDDPAEIPDDYPEEVVWEGLGLLPFSIVVHYRSDHPEARAVEDEVTFYRQNGIAYRTLRDGEAFAVEGGPDTLRIAGSSA